MTGNCVMPLRTAVLILVFLLIFNLFGCESSNPAYTPGDGIGIEIVNIPVDGEIPADVLNIISYYFAARKQSLTDAFNLENRYNTLLAKENAVKSKISESILKREDERIYEVQRYYVLGSGTDFYAGCDLNYHCDYYDHYTEDGKLYVIVTEFIHYTEDDGTVATSVGIAHTMEFINDGDSYFLNNDAYSDSDITGTKVDENGVVTKGLLYPEIDLQKVLSGAAVAESGVEYEFTDGVLYLISGDFNRDFFSSFERRDETVSIIAAEGVRFADEMSNAFYGYDKCENIDFSRVDVSEMTQFSGFFQNLEKLTTVNLSGWDTSNATNFAAMFNLCRSLKSVDLSGFDTSNVTDMRMMFAMCGSLEALDVSGFDTSKVVNTENMFFACESLTELDVSGFDTSNVTNMSGMFAKCGKLTELDLSGFDTSNATDMAHMFSECESLTALDVSGFKTSNVKMMTSMFASCRKLEALDLSSFDTSNVIGMESMFFACESLTELDVSGFDTSNVIFMDGMFAKCGKLTELDLSGFDTSNVENMIEMFSGCVSLKRVDLSGFDLTNVKSTEKMFERCDSLENIPEWYVKADDTAN